MRYLLVDMGNTRLKWASLVAGGLQTGAALVHRDKPLPDVLAQAWSDLPPPDEVLVACVASDDKKQTLAGWLSQRWSCVVNFLQSPAQANGVFNSYAQPQMLGSDRWAAMVAACRKSPAAVCVVNCGSAVTIDVVDSRGQHQGGLILPGLHAMLETLGRRTSLPAVEITEPEQVATLAHSTRDAMVAGAVLAITSVIEKTIAGMQQKGLVPATCYLAGGDAPVISANLAVEHQLEADLVLQGLAIIAQST